MSEAARALAAALAARREELLGPLARRLGDRALAEDVLSDALERSLDELAALREPSAAMAWLRRVVHPAAIDRQRRDAVARRRLAAYAAELDAHRDDDEPTRAICRCVAEIAAGLRAPYAEALRRVEIEGARVKDYASEAGISSNAAGVRVFRARAQLADGVKARCASCAARGCTDCTCAG